MNLCDGFFHILLSMAKISFLISIVMISSFLGASVANAEPICEQRDNAYNFAENLLDDDSLPGSCVELHE